jgi:addiction module HigA family antidote
MLPKNRITSHPGEVLADEFMKPLNLSATRLARALHVPPNRITSIIKGQRGITGDTALRLSRYFGTSPELWMNLQALHDLSRANVEAGAAVEREVKRRDAA